MGQRTVKRRLFCIRASSLHHTRWDTHQVLPVRRAEVSLCMLSDHYHLSWQQCITS